MYVPLTNNTVITQTLIAANYTPNATPQACTSVDGLNNASTMHIVNVGNSADTLAAGLYWSVTLEESDSAASGFAAVTSDDQIEGTFLDAATGQIALINAPGEDSLVLEVEYKNAHSASKRYSRINLVVAGNHTSGTPIGAVGIAHFLDR